MLDQYGRNINYAKISSRIDVIYGADIACRIPVLTLFHMRIL